MYRKLVGVLLTFGLCCSLSGCSALQTEMVGGLSPISSEAKVEGVSTLEHIMSRDKVLSKAGFDYSISKVSASIRPLKENGSWEAYFPLVSDLGYALHYEDNGSKAVLEYDLDVLKLRKALRGFITTVYPKTKEQTLANNFISFSPSSNPHGLGIYVLVDDFNMRAKSLEMAENNKRDLAVLREAASLVDEYRKVDDKIKRIDAIKVVYLRKADFDEADFLKKLDELDYSSMGHDRAGVFNSAYSVGKSNMVETAGTAKMLYTYDVSLLDSEGNYKSVLIDDSSKYDTFVKSVAVFK